MAPGEPRRPGSVRGLTTVWTALGRPAWRRGPPVARAPAGTHDRDPPRPPRARDLLDRDEGGIEMSRVADELNDTGIEPRDDVDGDDPAGLELERAEWTGRP